MLARSRSRLIARWRNGECRAKPPAALVIARRRPPSWVRKLACNPSIAESARCCDPERKTLTDGIALAAERKLA